LGLLNIFANFALRNKENSPVELYANCSTGFLLIKYLDNEEKNNKAQEAWQQEVAQIDLQIREHQTVINQLRQCKRELIAAHRKKRKPSWNDETPLYRLINLQQFEYYQLMIAEWQKRTTETLNPRKTTFFTFPPHLKHYVFHALAAALATTPPVFKVSTLQLCHYLAGHSDLGSAESIKKALQRIKNKGENYLNYLEM
jgi:hypothetical protein